MPCSLRSAISASASVIIDESSAEVSKEACGSQPSPSLIQIKTIYLSPYVFRPCWAIIRGAASAPDTTESSQVATVRRLAARVAIGERFYAARCHLGWVSSRHCIQPLRARGLICRLGRIRFPAHRDCGGSRPPPCDGARCLAREARRPDHQTRTTENLLDHSQSCNASTAFANPWAPRIAAFRLGAICW